MSSSDRECRLTADALLLEERRRRLLLQEELPLSGGDIGACRQSGDAAPQVPPSMAARVPDQPAERDLISEVEDHIVEEGRAATPGKPENATGLELYSPLSLLTLAALPWSGSIDHAALQRTLQCRPIVSRKWRAEFDDPPFAALVSGALPEKARAEPALYGVLGIDDIVAVQWLSRHGVRDAGHSLLQAAALPVDILGTASSVAAAARPAFSTYRNASLLSAWQSALGKEPDSDLQRERNSAAMQLLSTLRALLGES